MNNIFSAIVPHKTFKFINIIQLGCGGTGGYMSLLLTRFLNIYASKCNGEIYYDLYDEDVVEEKNINRQNFVMDDIGEIKSEVISNRYRTDAYNINSFGHFKKNNAILLSNVINKNIQDTLYVIVGATDSVEARILIMSVILNIYINKEDLYKHFEICGNDFLNIEEKFKDIKNMISKRIPVVYFDAGNTYYNGQTMMFDFINKPNESWIRMMSYKDDLEKTDSEISKADNNSCADFGEQSIVMNAMAALHMYKLISEYLLFGYTVSDGVIFTRHTSEEINLDMMKAMENRII